jgi:very-short-patch-repair endonuclease
MKGLEINQLKAIKYATQLEQNATLAEKILREALLEYGFNFEFQKPLYSEHTCYIADFYMLGKRLIIELDGSAHNGRAEQDAKRTANILKYHNYHVLRIKNKAVFADVSAVVNKIQDWKPYKTKPKAQPKAQPKPKAKKKQPKKAKYWCSMYDPLEKKRARVMAKVLGA